MDNSGKDSQWLGSFLVGSKRVEMIQIMHKYQSGQIDIREFLSYAQQLLGSSGYQTLMKETRAKKGVLNTQEMGEALVERISEAVEPTNGILEGVGSMPQLGREKGMGNPGWKPGEDNGGKGPDVTKMDADSLQDILQYSGVDLKEEADNIMREQSHLLCEIASTSSEEPRNRAELLFNTEELKECILRAVNKYKLLNKEIDMMIMELLLYGLQIRFMGIINELVLISRSRVDVLRSRFKLRIENDPRRQLYVLNKILYHRSIAFLNGEEKEDLRNEDGGGKRSKSGDGTLLAPANIGSLEREDLYIKTRITNATALNQLGVPIKNWMLSGNEQGSSSSMMISMGGAQRGSRDGSPGNLGSLGRYQNGSKRAPRPKIPPSEMLSGISEKEWRPQVFEREICVQDFIFFMQHDPELSHSKILTKTIAMSK